MRQKLIFKLRKLLCKIGKHEPDMKYKYSGHNILSVCKYCGKPIIKNGNGSWDRY